VRARWSGALKLPSGSRRSPAAKQFLVNFRLKIVPVVAMVLRRFTGNASTRSSKKGTLYVHYLVCLSQHTTYCGMWPKMPRVSLVLLLELKLVHFMCKMWHLVRILLTIISKFWPSVVHSTDTHSRLHFTKQHIDQACNKHILYQFSHDARKRNR